MKKYTHFFLLFLLMGLAGCDDFVEVDVPNSQLTGTVVFEDKATANAALIALYSKLRDTGLLTGKTDGCSAGLGLYADELIYHGTNESFVFLYNNTLLATTGLTAQKWNESYHQIYSANAIVEGCQNSTTLATNDSNLFIGEALFIRAMIHFYLMNLYGNIPYATSTNYEQNRLLFRLPEALVFDKIIDDLEDAISLLPENYSSTERVRPNQAAAKALLARVYLYKGDWAAASNAASAVLNQPMYVMEPDLSKVFLKGSTSAIWQFSPQSATHNTFEGATFIFLTGPPTNVSIQPELYSSFETTDLRKSNWIAVRTNGSNSWYHAFKYKQRTTTNPSVEYSIILRVEEMYLIRAEARARQGELIGAKEDLNAIRTRAGLLPTTAVTQSELVAAILKERSFELFTELGHRFFDLKRTNALDATLGLSKPSWDINDRVWPIPESELLANPNLTQNAGY